MELKERHAGVEAIERIVKIVGEDNVRVTQAELYTYGFSAGIHQKTPDAVIKPISAEQISQILLLANQMDFPVTPRGAGTALCGHTTPVGGGIILDLQKMNRIKEIRPQDLLCIVEPGVVCDHLNLALKPHKFFIPGPASSEAATVGGMTATNSSGDKALKYGATRDYVLGLQAVMPTGEIVRFGTRTMKNSSGYQLDRLIVGSEGTLGIISEVTFRLTALPVKTSVCVASFKELIQAGEAVADIISAPILPSQLELMSSVCIQAVNKATDLGLPEAGGMLLIACDGHPEAVREEIEKVHAICRKNSAFHLDYTDDPIRIEALWRGRKQMIPSLSSLRDDYSTVMMADDMAVPISKVPDAIAGLSELQKKYDILFPPYGHAGDGNLHTKVLLDAENPDHWKQAEAAVKEIYHLVLSLGGTVTGEHGIGMTKAEYFMEEHADAIPFMKAIKRSFDPNNILNPYKLFDWTGGCLSHLRYPVRISHAE